ncbi:hypothetical protein [Solicola sp. PLA-1-18]|uniref:hypothetical protein n=1 Tax=Solicola sp. PLA-1-18 TaxID=3380532 RepID=UPI003B760C1E
MPAPTPVPVELRDRPFTLAEARAAGLSSRVLNGRRFVPLLRGVHAPADLEPTRDVMTDAGFLALPAEAIASHGTAGHLLGLPVPTTTRPSFWVPQSRNGLELAGVDLHRYKERPPSMIVDGRPVTTVGKTFVDLAVLLCLWDLVAVGDAAVRRRLIELAALRLRCREPRRRWIRRARWAASLVREGVDSRAETLLRLLLVFADLPEPVVGRPAFDAAGNWLATPDLSYPELKIAIEYDGRHHADDRRQWARDVLRVEGMAADGWIVIVVVADHLFRHPDAVVDRVHHALITRGAVGVPRYPHQNWRRHLLATQS